MKPQLAEALRTPGIHFCPSVFTSGLQATARKEDGGGESDKY